MESTPKKKKTKSRAILFIITMMICFISQDFRKEKSLLAGVTPVQSIFYTAPFLLFFTGVLISSAWIEPEDQFKKDQLQSLRKLDKLQNQKAAKLIDNISLPKSHHQSLRFESKLSGAGLNRAALPQTRYSLFHPHAFEPSHY